jgi:hypothetical protein
MVVIHLTECCVPITVKDASLTADPALFEARTTYTPVSSGLRCIMFNAMYPKLKIVLIREPEDGHKLHVLHA